MKNKNRKEAMKRHITEVKGFSLVELLVAVAIFGLVIGGVSFFAVDSLRGSRNIQLRVKAVLYVREATHAVLLNKDMSWRSIIDQADGNTKHVVYSNGHYSLADGGEDKQDVSLSIVIDSVYRDGSGEIVQTGGIEDPHSKMITVSASWPDMFRTEQSIHSTFYVNDWNTKYWVDTEESDFIAGVHDLTIPVSNNGGEVELESKVYGDWCNPSLAMSSADLPGQGVAQTLWAVPGEAFAGTGQNASGLSFIDIVIGEEDPPVVTIQGSYDGAKTNNVFGEDVYAYIATDTNAEEIQILDISGSSISKIGYCDIPGSSDAESVFVLDDIGYAVAGSSFYTFNLTSRSGSRLVMDSVSLAGTGKSIKVQGNFAYVAIDSSSTQMQIINVADPSNIQIIGNAQLTAGAGVDVFVREDSNRLYLATAASSSYHEVFILDSTTKTGAHPAITSFDTNGMGPTGLVVVPDERLIVVGKSGEEYQVYNIESETFPSQCGGIQVDSGINDLASVTNANGDVFSYIVTGDTSAEMKLIKGGVGGGGPGGHGFVPAGTFISRVFDTQSDESYYYTLEVDGTFPAGTDIRAQIRSGPALDLSSRPWIGPDGTGMSYFSEGTGSPIPPTLSGNRYVQYKVLLDSDTVYTPIFEELRINYQ